MVVNSFEFLLFFIIVFAVYYAPGIGQHATRQNTWLLLASYFFYGFVDWKMLPLLLGITILFYWLGSLIYKAVVEGNKKRAKLILRIGVTIGIGILLYFKYLNFFADSIADMLRQIGLSASWSTLNIILPIGVSFFTFKLISYLIEIKRKKIHPAENFLEFATYIAFFPTILSGPIDRPNTFLSQLNVKRVFDYYLAIDGCRQILWGMFTKMCIADNIAVLSDSIYTHPELYNGKTVILVALLCPLQVYADFDGYSNMAIGVGKLLGLRVTKNFDHPLLARNTAEYWRRWHISLTTWITDYVFMPLNIKFRDLGNSGIILAATANMVLIGLWHGAKWNYALFGLYHGLLFIPLIYSGSFSKSMKIRPNKYGLPILKDFLGMIMTYFLIALGLIIFKTESVSEIGKIVASMTNAISDTLLFDNRWALYAIILYTPILIVCDWYKRNHDHPLVFDTIGRIPRWCVCWLLCAAIYVFQGSAKEFIYFHF